VPAFDLDTAVLVHSQARPRERHTWLLWPALQYRVVTPLVHDPEINAFQRAMLGLARAGQRDLGKMAELLALDAEFAEIVRDDLRTLRYLDEFGAVTAAGADALADGFLDPQRVVVSHVYQDLMTGVLLPASVPAPMLVNARWASRDFAELDLGTAGSTAPIRALAVPPGERYPDPPAADEVIEAVSRGSRGAPAADDGVRWQKHPPDRVAARVSLMTSGQPVYLPVAIVLSRGDTDRGTLGGNGPTWLAYSPFNERPSHLLRRLAALRCASYAPLRRRIEGLTGRSAEALLAEYDRLGADLRSHYGERLDRLFGPALREHHELVELLTLLELHAELGRKPGNRASELNTAANAAWRIQETVLREIAHRYPANVGPWADPTGSGPRRPLWQRLMTVCEQIGLRSTEYRAISQLKRFADIRRVLQPSGDAPPQVPALLAAAVISAQQGDADHPVRKLAANRPTLLTDLVNASAIRNDGSHGELTQIDPDAVGLSRKLAHETVAAFLGVPASEDTTDHNPWKDTAPGHG
jgi:hypothetical protein